MAAVFLKALILLIHPQEEINTVSLRGLQGCLPCQVQRRKKKQLVSRTRDVEKLQ